MEDADGQHDQPGGGDQGHSGCDRIEEEKKRNQRAQDAEREEVSPGFSSVIFEIQCEANAGNRAKKHQKSDHEGERHHGDLGMDVKQDSDEQRHHADGQRPAPVVEFVPVGDCKKDVGDARENVGDAKQDRQCKVGLGGRHKGINADQEEKKPDDQRKIPVVYGAFDGFEDGIWHDAKIEVLKKSRGKTDQMIGQKLATKALETKPERQEIGSFSPRNSPENGLF